MPACRPQNCACTGLWLGGIFGIAHVDSFGCTHILSTISDVNVGEELEESGRSYVVRLPATPCPRHRARPLSSQHRHPPRRQSLQL